MGRRKPNFLSIFAGCGGFDLGFSKAGFLGLGAVDINPRVLMTHKSNLKTKIFLEDLSDGKIRSTEFNDVDVLIAGSPCQGFSTAGKRNLNDPRNGLLISAGKIAITLRPKVFVAENVPGVISGKHRHYWDELHSMLRTVGYKTTDIKLCGTDVGLAQMRVRCFMVAWLGQMIPSLEIPVTTKTTLKDVLSNLSRNDDHKPVFLTKNENHYLIAKRISPGQKLSNVRLGSNAVHTWDIPEVFGRTNARERQILEKILRIRRRERVRDFGDADPIPRLKADQYFGSENIERLLSKGYLRKINGHIDLTNTFNGKYRRLSWKNPSNTVDTRFGDPRLYLHPKEHRGFTVREAARIQGFPDSFKFSGNEKEQYTMIGNAVPPPMAQSVGTLIRSSFFT